MLDDNAVFCNQCGASFGSSSGAGFQQPQQPQFNQPQQPQFNQPQQPQFNQPQQFGQPQQPQFNQPQQFGQPQPFGQPAFQGGAAVKQGSNKTVFVIIGIAVAALVVGLILFLFVFKSDYKKDIIGTWVDETDSSSSMTFEEGGKMTMNLMGFKVSGTYEISGSTLTMKYSVMGVSNKEEFKIDKISGSEMTLKGTGSDSNTMYKLKKK